MAEELSPFDCVIAEEEPGPSTHADRPVARGIRPAENQGPNLSVEMQQVIERAIERGITAGLHRERQSSKRTTARSSQQSVRRDQVQGPASPGTSIATEVSILEEDNIGQQELSEDENPPDKPAFTELFKPSLFKAILHKARASTELGSSNQGEAAASGSQDPKEGLFKENAPAQDLVPVSDLFVNVVQRPWAQPCSLTNPSEADKNIL